MKTKYKKKIWFNWWHFGVIILGLIYSFRSLGYGCVYGITWMDCFSQRIVLPLSWLGVILLIVVLYFIVTLIFWLYYRNKR